MVDYLIRTIFQIQRINYSRDLDANSFVGRLPPAPFGRHEHSALEEREKKVYIIFVAFETLLKFSSRRILRVQSMIAVPALSMSHFLIQVIEIHALKNCWTTILHYSIRFSTSADRILV